MVRSLAIVLCLGVAGAWGAAPAFLELLPGASTEGWVEHSFVGNTRYQTDTLAGVPALRAVADGSASALYREQSISLERWPVLRWRWQVRAALDAADERSKGGDDFAARIYVVARHPLLRWKTRTLCYVWASREPAGADWANPYADDVRMIVLRSGGGDAGRWVEERRDLGADFERWFGATPSSIDAVAIMTDTDQTGRSATAWYEGLRFEPKR